MNYGTYLYLIDGPEFKFKDGQTFKIKFNPTCNTENVIYIITYKACQHNYIGYRVNHYATE